MIRHAIIRALDWLDDTVLGHSCYWICHRIGTSSWWDARGEGRRNDT